MPAAIVIPPIDRPLPSLDAAYGSNPLRNWEGPVARSPKFEAYRKPAEAGWLPAILPTTSPSVSILALVAFSPALDRSPQQTSGQECSFCWQVACLPTMRLFYP